MNYEFEALDDLVQQMCQLLAQFSSKDYRTALELYEGSSIGKHFRHIHDFFHCLDKGLDAGIIDYGLRDRSIELEEDPIALSVSLIRCTRKINAHPLDKELWVTSDVAIEQNSNSATLHASSLGRELLFVYSHTVHHLAIIKMGMKVLDSKITVDKNFGVAPSTVVYQTSKKENG
jgi:hypothetical protein